MRHVGMPFQELGDRLPEAAGAEAVDADEPGAVGPRVAEDEGVGGPVALVAQPPR